MGVQLIQAASRLPTPPAVHAFARDPSKLSASNTALCASVLTGDARSPADLTKAIQACKPAVVIVTIGSGKSTSQSDIRTACAHALSDSADALDETARIVVVSSVGAGGSHIVFKWGYGAFLSFLLRHVLRDHDGQEREFRRKFGEKGEGKGKRLLIVRPTALTDDKAVGSEKLVTFGDRQRAQTTHVDRADISQWIMGEVCGDGMHFGACVNITTGL